MKRYHTDCAPAFISLLCCLAAGIPEAAGEPIIVGRDALLPDNPRMHYSRTVNDAPADGEILRLNPPRFRWKFSPEGDRGGAFTFVFQIDDSPSFDSPAVDITTPFNFYNTIAPLDGGGPYYWRVGYIDGDDAGGERPSVWSPVRSFRIDPGAEVWDRSVLADPDFSGKPHPRILLGGDAVDRIQALVRTDPVTREVFERMRRTADETLGEAWYRDFPANDTEEAPEIFYRMAQHLCTVAFMYRVTGDSRYASVKDRAVTFASYPKGGRSSPEPMGESNEDSTQNTEFLALLYDWLYPDLTTGERALFVKSLEWRIEHFVYDFAWKRTRNGRREVHFSGSLATTGASHSFEGFWDTFPAALAIYEDSEAARECFGLGVNWMVGVCSSHGFDEGWNEGPGYSNSKFKWILNGMQYLDSVFPEYRIGANPWLDRIGEWFRRVTPVGMKHAPWGHQSNNRSYYDYNRLHNFRRLSHLTGSGELLTCWNELGGPEDIASDTSRPWCECAIAANRETPLPSVEADPVGLFPLGGWVMAGTKPPSLRECYETSAGMIFQSSLGGYSHSFADENSFHIYAYGEDVSYAAGTSEYEPHAFHSMSHNVILIDGLGQIQQRPPATPRVGYIRAFKRGDGYVYWAGDATNAYSRVQVERPGDWWGTLDDIYSKRDLRYLERYIRHVVFVDGKYFVIFDDLACSKPAQYTWLYHILPHDPIRLDEETMTFDYRVGDVPVRVAHIAHRGDLEFIDMQGADGFRNPLTGEDYTDKLGRHPTGIRKEEHIAGHNIYISNRTKAEDFHFLTVIAPVRPGEGFPVIRRLDEKTVEVAGTIVSFDPKTARNADIVVDVPALRGDQPKVSAR